jgi:hypothetical protein
VRNKFKSRDGPAAKWKSPNSNSYKIYDVRETKVPKPIVTRTGVRKVLA